MEECKEEQSVSIFENTYTTLCTCPQNTTYITTQENNRTIQNIFR